MQLNSIVLIQFYKRYDRNQNNKKTSLVFNIIKKALNSRIG